MFGYFFDCVGSANRSRCLGFLMLTQSPYLSASLEIGIYSHFLSVPATNCVGVWHTQKRDWILMGWCKKNLEHKVSWNWRALLTNVFPRYEGIQNNQLLRSALKFKSLKCILAKRSWHTTQPNHFSLISFFKSESSSIQYLNNYEEGAIHGNFIFADHR